MPRDTLSVEQIVGAAIELLDDEGLDGLNMRALGNRLGTAATAIYWHIKTKDELVQLAADAVWSEVELPELADTDWRTAATALATGLHAMLARHPWLGQAFGSHLLSGTARLRYDDRSRAVYEQAGFPPEDADRAAATVLIFVIGSTLGTAAQISITTRARRNPKQLDQDVMPKTLEPDNTFDFGLEAILTGFEARLSS